MRFRLIQFLAGAIIALFTQSVGAATPTERPMNVLFLVADDLNSWMLENTDRYAGKVVAPNLRKLANSVRHLARRSFPV